MKKYEVFYTDKENKRILKEFRKKEYVLEFIKSNDLENYVIFEVFETSYIVKIEDLEKWKHIKHYQ